ncbi:MAG TPA: hypothetical protein VNR39_09095 [Pseudolabrys sp.]|nr:hypothetical protein [Pseudolabrys sp.]
MAKIVEAQVVDPQELRGPREIGADGVRVERKIRSSTRRIDAMIAAASGVSSHRACNVVR